MTKKWFFKYDPDKENEFIPGAILSEEQPENATDVEPNGFHGLPKWNESSHKWEGQSLADWLQEQKKNDIKQVDQTQQLAQLAMQVMQDNAKLTARVKALEAKEANNV